MFTDWDFTDNDVSAMGRDKTLQNEPQAISIRFFVVFCLFFYFIYLFIFFDYMKVLNAMWYELCTIRKETDGNINLHAYNNLFKYVNLVCALFPIVCFSFCFYFSFPQI